MGTWPMGLGVFSACRVRLRGVQLMALRFSGQGADIDVGQAAIILGHRLIILIRCDRWHQGIVWCPGSAWVPLPEAPASGCSGGGASDGHSQAEPGNEETRAV